MKLADVIPVSALLLKFKLLVRLEHEPAEEVVVATNPDVEGEATAHVVSELARTRGLAVTRIAQGVPFGGELEYVDAGTIARAMDPNVGVEKEADALQCKALGNSRHARAMSGTQTKSIVCEPSPKISGASPFWSRWYQRMRTSVYLPSRSIRGPYTLK